MFLRIVICYSSFYLLISLYMAAMKEKIISLLEAWCTLSILTAEWHTRHIIAHKKTWMWSYLICQGTPADIYFSNHEIDIVSILEVIPPTLHEYKVGDKMMVYYSSTGKRYWPKVLTDLRTENRWEYVLAIWDEPIESQRICPYHEWVQYNPLPTN